MNDSELKSRIMRRVYGVYFLRQLSQPALKVAALFALALVFKSLVSVASVLDNMSRVNTVQGFFYYAYDAFMSTEFLVQLVIVTSILLVGYMLKDVASVVNPEGKIAQV